MRRVRDRAKTDELFPVWRYHPFLTNSTEDSDQADITHRRHAIIETVLADVIDGPLAHLPSGRFAANGAWAICTAITHNLLRAAGTLAEPTPCRCSRRDTALSPRRGASAAGPAATTTRPAPARPLALGRTMDNQLWTTATGPPSGSLIHPPPQGPTGERKAGQTSRSTPTADTSKINDSKEDQQTDHATDRG